MKPVLLICLQFLLTISPDLFCQTNTFPPSGNVGIGTTTPEKLLEVAGVIKASSLSSSDGSRIFMPGGASYVSTSSSVTGAIKIKLPTVTRNSSTMMMFTVNIYQYNTGKSHQIRISGYNYNTGGWYNVSATNLTDAGDNFTIRYGDDYASDCVWIGETNSIWSYPQVFVSDFQGGYAGYSSDWADGWNISFVTAFDYIEVSRIAARALTSTDDNIDLPFYNNWRYIKNSATLGGLKLGTGNANGTYTDGISITSGGNYITLHHPTNLLGDLYINQGYGSMQIRDEFGAGILAYPSSWARSYSFLDYNSGALLAGFGGLGSNNTVDNLWIGKAYNDVSGVFFPDGGAELYYDNSKKLETTSNGVSISGNLLSTGGCNFDSNTLFVDGVNHYVGIGTSSPQNKLDVYGTVHAKEFKASLDGWSDYVFDKDYKLMSLKDVENYVKRHSKLPDIPSASEVTKNGLNLAEMNSLLLRKIEELTLHAIEQQKEIELLKQKVFQIESKHEK